MVSREGGNMTNDAPVDDRPGVDSASFEEWLEQAAESKGVSKRELMNQMLSSYWILDELTGLVGETEAEMETKTKAEPGPGTPREPPESASDRTPDSADSPGTEAPAETERAGDDGPLEERTSTEENIREIRTAIQQLLDAQLEPADDPSETSPTLDGGVVSVVSELQRQVGKFEARLDDIEDRQNSRFDRFSNELQLLLDRVGELEGKHDRFVERSELEPLADDIRRLNERLEGIRTANEELEARVDREFDSIEELFRRLLDELDEIDAELEGATESVREDLKPLEERAAKRDRLAELKTEALRRDVRSGTCGNCDRSVDLALLEVPECPNCMSRFVGIRNGGWNPFQSPTIEAETSPTDDA